MLAAATTTAAMLVLTAMAGTALAALPSGWSLKDPPTGTTTCAANNNESLGELGSSVVSSWTLLGVDRQAKSCGPAGTQFVLYSIASGDGKHKVSGWVPKQGGGATIELTVCWQYLQVSPSPTPTPAPTQCVVLT